MHVWRALQASYSQWQTPDLTRPESPIAHVGQSGRLLLPGWMSDRRGCTPVPDRPNRRILASPRLCIHLTSGSTVNLGWPHVVHHQWAWAQIWSTCQAGLARQGHGVEPHWLLRQLGCHLTFQWSIGGWASSLMPGERGHWSDLSEHCS